MTLPLVLDPLAGPLPEFAPGASLRAVHEVLVRVAGPYEIHLVRGRPWRFAPHRGELSYPGGQRA